MLRRTMLGALALLTIAAPAATAPKAGPGHETHAYHGFTLIDPATRVSMRDAYLVVRDGMIVRIGKGRLPALPERAHTHDLGGRYVLPGFIDAHAHITTTGMQKVEVRDGKVLISMESDDAVTRNNARVALSRGVTTIRNPGGDPGANAHYDRMIRSGAWLGPEALHAGAVIEPPPFAGGMFAYPRTDAEWNAEAARQAKLGMRYFKLYASLSEGELAIGIKAAHAHGLKAIAHLNAVSWTRAARLGIDGLEHALPTSPELLSAAQRARFVARPDSTFMYRWFELADYDSPEIREMIALLARKHIVTDMTLVVNELVYGLDDLDRYYPQKERVGAILEVLDKALTGLRASSAGWSKEDFARAKAVMPKVLELARRLHAAGVPMMIGTDAGGGIFYARELVLHRTAGIPAWDVLRMATSDAAKAMGMERRIGRIKAGYEADLVILDRNPLEDIAAASEVYGVVANGHLMKPAELLQRD